ncbi:MAG: hypothetical protein C4307_02490 [Chloroflexota bacterium]
MADAHAHEACAKAPQASEGALAEYRHSQSQAGPAQGQGRDRKPLAWPREESERSQAERDEGRSLSSSLPGRERRGKPPRGQGEDGKSADDERALDRGQRPDGHEEEYGQKERSHEAGEEEGKTDAGREAGQPALPLALFPVLVTTSHVAYRAPHRLACRG